jgi:signal transduction histidine kinase
MMEQHATLTQASQLAALTTGVQVAAQASFTIALGSLSARLGRPLMQSLAVLWGIRLAEMLVALLVLLAGERSTWRAIVAIVFISGMQATLVPAGLRVAHTATAPAPIAAPLPWRSAFGIGAALGLTAHLVTLRYFDGSEFVRIVWMRAFMLATYLWIWVAFLRARRGAASPAAINGLVFGGTGLLCFTLLDGGLLLYAAERTVSMGMGVLIVLSGVSGALLFGVMSLLAALEAERDAIQLDAERLRAAALYAAESDRLRSLGQLAGGVAHDFNNLLGVMLGSVDLAVADLGDARPEVTTELKEVRSAAERGAALTRRLLSYARRRPEHPTSFVPAVAMREIMPMLQRLMAGRVRLIADITAAQCIRMDPVQFEQIILNLVVNARDALGHDGGEIVVRLHDASSVEPGAARLGVRHSRPYVRLDVSDTGRGIPAELLPVLFEPFTTSKGDLGTGLGLATVAAAIRDVDGALDLATSSQEGTRFTVWLPVAAA